MKAEPLLSIIIPTYNAAKYLDDCLSSIAVQAGPDIEVIVQDSASSDGSKDVFKKFENLIDYLCVEVDRGQSDAIDRGFQKARGRYLTWLNADDVLLPTALNSIRHCVRRCPEAGWWVGDTALMDSDGLVTSASRAGDCIVGPLFRYVATYGPSSVFRKELYEEVGGLDLSFHYMMDTDLWYRFAQAGFRYRRAHQYWWGFRQHKDSKTTAHLFNRSEHDPFSPQEFRQNAERQELHLRHGVGCKDFGERASLQLARLLRCAKMEIPLQLLDSTANRGKHWRTFTRFPAG